MNLLKVLALTICLSSPLANAGNNSDDPAIIKYATCGIFAYGLKVACDSLAILHNTGAPHQQVPEYTHALLPFRVNNRYDCAMSGLYGLALMTTSAMVLAASIHPETCECPR